MQMKSQKFPQAALSVAGSLIRIQPADHGYQRQKQSQARAKKQKSGNHRLKTAVALYSEAVLKIGPDRRA